MPKHRRKDKDKAAACGAKPKKDESETRDERGGPETYEEPKPQPDDGGEKSPRPEGGKRGNFGFEKAGQSKVEQSEGPNQAGRKLKPFQVKETEKGARAKGGEKSVRDGGKGKHAPVGGGDKSAWAEGSDGPTGGKGKVIEKDKPDPGNVAGEKPGGGLAAEKVTVVEKLEPSAEKPEESQSDACAEKSDKPEKVSKACQYEVTKRRKPRKRERIRVTQSAFRLGRFTSKPLLLVLITSLTTALILLLLYVTLGDLKEKEFLKIPTNIDEVRALENLLNEYKNLFPEKKP